MSAIAGSDADGIEIHAGDAADVTVTADVDVMAQDEASTAGGVSLEVGNELTANIDGSVSAVADGDTRGINVKALGGGAQLAVTGNVDVAAQDDWSNAWGVYIDAQGDLTAAIDGNVSVTGGKGASGIDVYAGDGGRFTVTGNVDVIARDDGSEAVGMLLGASNSSVEHHGSMQVSAQGTAVGVRLVLIDFATGEFDTADNVDFQNSGSIVVSAEESIGVIVAVNDHADIRNDGVINAAGGIAVDGSGSVGSIAFVNKGDVSGDVLLGQGDDEVTLHYGSVLDGVLDGGGGNDMVSFVGPALSEPAPGAQTSLPTIVNFEEAIVLGGNWSFGGGTTLGALDLEDSSLQIDGDVSIGALEISGGELGGGGVLTGSVTNSSGVVAPCNSLGIFTIDGHYTQGENGVLEIEVGASSKPLAGVDYDQLLISGGIATFDDGTTIRIVPQPGVYGYRLRDRGRGRRPRC